MQKPLHGTLNSLSCTLFFCYFSEEICTLVIAETFPEDSGIFTCTATNEHGSVTSSAQLTVCSGMWQRGAFSHKFYIIYLWSCQSTSLWKIAAVRHGICLPQGIHIKQTVCFLCSFFGLIFLLMWNTFLNFCHKPGISEALGFKTRWQQRQN